MANWRRLEKEATTVAHILVVDDEVDLAWALRQSLSDEGYEVSIAHDGEQAIAAVARECPDLIILDIKMPRMNGLEVCRRLRRDPSCAAVPILFLTVRSDIQNRIKGLDEGADDYLSQPFDLNELKARVRALLRRAQPVAQLDSAQKDRLDVVQAGETTMNLRTRQVWVGEKSVALTPMEFKLLHHFIASPREVFSVQQLLAQVWGYPPGTDKPGLVRWHIKKLRDKIESDLSDPTHIRTMRGHGYFFAPDEET